MIRIAHRNMVLVLLTLVYFAGASVLDADPGRFEQELSGEGWRLWRDRAADWKHDIVHLPPVDLQTLEVNPPTCGWDELPFRVEKSVAVPGTVEEHFWSANGNPNGIAGDYRGVSWWSRTFTVPSALTGKRIVLAFDSVNLRAEVFVNRTLVGYDVIGNTPFEVDITSVVKYSDENTLDIRITDPVGTFAWDDENMLHWGPNYVPSVHGFGGITGKVVLRATDPVSIRDIYIQNKPDPKQAEVFVTLTNTSNLPVDGALNLVIHDEGNPDAILWSSPVKTTAAPGIQVVTFNINASKAKLWNIGDAHVYDAAVTFTSSDGSIADAASQPFGFRYFTVGEKNGDKRFYLNGKRVFIFAAMTRGFWPKNGIFPTLEMAVRDMELAVELGFNMMLYHRAIGQPVSMDMADRMGVLSYEEPGGYLCQPMPDETAQHWRREKLRRMIIRDRSRPSMTIYNIDDWSFREPGEWDYENIRMVHDLDPSRIVTFNCISTPVVPYDRNDPMKLHMLPYDNEPHIVGWLDPYHFTAQPGYIDEYYENPRYYLRRVFDPNNYTMGDSLDAVPSDEIIFYGEEGGVGALLRLGAIKNELMRTGADGWREQELLEWHDSYDRFLERSGMRRAFPTVDHLMLALGENMHYFMGRDLENCRLMNTVDAFVLNGWASAMTHTDFGDTYRYPTADPSIIRHYTQPLYLAVKIRDKVLEIGDIPVADVFIVNEMNLRGTYTLRLELEAPDGSILLESSQKVSVTGGEEYGELLIEDIRMPSIGQSGAHVLNATLLDRDGKVRAEGFDDIFAADYRHGPGIPSDVAVIDTSGVINRFLSDARGITLPAFDPTGEEPEMIVVGAHDYRTVRNLGIPEGTRSLWPVMDMVANGTTLIVLEQADRWAEQMNSYYQKSIRYVTLDQWGRNGKYFVGTSPLLAGLPVAQSMNWEYQVLYQGDIRSLRMDTVGMDIIVGAAPDNTDTPGAALVRIPYGEGEVILTTLPILRELASDTSQSSVAKKLFMNLMELNHNEKER